MNKPILVTGSHRSGTTWVGKMINQSKDVGYINEPLSLWQTPGVFYPRPQYWYKYISVKDSDEYYRGFKDTLEFKYNIRQGLYSLISFKDILRLLKNCIVYDYYRYTQKKPLVKEPHALFSAEWLYENFNFDIIILIRHPAAFVESLKRTEWTHPFFHFLKQPELINKYLESYKSEIIEYTNNKKNIVKQGILLWNMIYSTVNNYRDKHEKWLFLRHEDISREPVKYFRKIFEYLRLNMDYKIIKKIEKYSSTNNKSISYNVNDIKINSEKNIYKWKESLSTNDIELIKKKTYDVWKYFYTEEEW